MNVAKDIENKITVSLCPTCNRKLRTLDTRPHLVYGFATVKRRRVCNKCDFKISTVEIPSSLGDDIFVEE